MALLVAPLGAPVTFTLWDRLAIEPGGFVDILYSLPGLVRYATPVAYTAAFLFGFPAVLILSHKRLLNATFTCIAGTLIGTVTGLLAGLHIAGYEIGEMAAYFAFDITSIYVPSAISGMVSSIIFLVVLKLKLKR